MLFNLSNGVQYEKTTLIDKSKNNEYDEVLKPKRNKKLDSKNKEDEKREKEKQREKRIETCLWCGSKTVTANRSHWNNKKKKHLCARKKRKKAKLIYEYVIE